MSDMLNQITSLNKKIEGLMQKRTRIEAQRELLEKRLREGVAAYKKEYNVDLEGATFAETKQNIMSQVEEVKSKVSKEFALASKVVECIELGNIDEANKLLGVPSALEGNETQPVRSSTSAVDTGLTGMEDVVEDYDNAKEMVKDDTVTDLENSASPDLSALDFGIDEDDDDMEEDLDPFGDDLGDIDDFGFASLLDKGKF